MLPNVVMAAADVALDTIDDVEFAAIAYSFAIVPNNQIIRSEMRFPHVLPRNGNTGTNKEGSQILITFQEQ